MIHSNMSSDSIGEFSRFEYVIDANGQLYGQNRQLMDENLDLVNKNQELYYVNVEIIKRNEQLMKELERLRNANQLNFDDETATRLKSELKEIKKKMANVCRTMDNALNVSREINGQINEFL